MIFVALVIVLCITKSYGGQPSSISDLKDALLLTQNGGGCFKLLTKDSTYGCEDVSGVFSEAPLQHFRSLDDTIEGKNSILATQFNLQIYSRQKSTNHVIESFPKVCQPSPSPEEPCSKNFWHPDCAFYNFLVGLDSVSFSSEVISPTGPLESAQTSPEWNPEGNGLRFTKLPFPVFVLDEDLIDKALLGAKENHKKSFSGALYHVKTKITMQAKQNSLHCLKKKSCKPLGGYSVLGMTPTSSQQEVILVMSKMDTSGFFLHRLIGADSSLSSLMVMLTAMEILALQDDFEQYKRQLAFLSLSGEPWDYMGSKRLVWELSSGEHSVFHGKDWPFKLEDLSHVIDLGQIGNPTLRAGQYQYFLHQKEGFGGVDPELKNIFLSTAREVSSEKISMKLASNKTRGLPPSSLEVLLSVNETYKGILLEEFDQSYTNKHYRGLKDDKTNLNTEALIKISILLAQALHHLATDDSTPLKVDEKAVVETVDYLVDCLTDRDKGFDCLKELSLISKKSKRDSESSQIEHYNSVFTQKDLQEQTFERKANIEKFIYKFMDLRLRKFPSDSPLLFFVPSYSLALKSIHCKEDKHLNSSCREWEVDLESEGVKFGRDKKWKEDQVWTESDWTYGSQKMELFMSEASTKEQQILIIGIFITLGTLLVSLVLQSVYYKRIKAA